MKTYIFYFVLFILFIFFTGCIIGETLNNSTSGTGSSYISGEYRTNSNYGYGLYQVRMKAAKNIGIVSSFFTYTGPSEGNPHDEIDIEFLGKDTTKVQLNYFTSGVGGHEQIIDLGFDASAGFHTYAFDWQLNSIKWYVDGVLVHTAADNIPTNPGKIMVNLWPGTGVDSWLGAYNGNTPLKAEYDWIKYESSINEGFDSYNTASWHKADGWSNGGFFNCTWKESQVTFSNGIMTLTLDSE